MAQKTFTRLVDDLDETEIADGAGQTVSFSLDGTSYELDLTNEHADELRGALARYVTAARKVGGQSVARRSNGTSARTRTKTDVDPAAVRAWAAADKVEVSARGRISAKVIEQYRAAGN